MAAGARHVPQRQVDHKAGHDRTEDSGPDCLEERGRRRHVADAMTATINDVSTKFVAPSAGNLFISRRFYRQFFGGFVALLVAESR
jgi:hypothetical protein